GYEPCGVVNWLDEEWHGRSQSVITLLAKDDIKLKKKLTDMECTISTMKQERINYRHEMNARYKKELACVVVVVALAIFYAMFAMMIRGFVSLILTSSIRRYQCIAFHLSYSVRIDA
ncbi:hypothetical protein ZWY2020_040484, partial [Hordeum vulgare]